MPIFVGLIANSGSLGRRDGCQEVYQRAIKVLWFSKVLL